MRRIPSWIGPIVVPFIFALSRIVKNEYYMFAGYVVLQYIILASAWNILGGYSGYVNFGSAAFFAIGAYGTVVLDKLWQPPLVVVIVFGGIVASLVGLVTAYCNAPPARGVSPSRPGARDCFAEFGDELGIRRRPARLLQRPSRRDRRLL